MKKFKLFALIAFGALPVSLLAQTPPPLPAALQGTPTSVYTYLAMTLVATGVPLLVGLVKVWFPKLQKSYSHVFPLVATVLGVLLVWGINQLSTLHLAGVLGIFLGAAGIGLREFYDQTKQLWPKPPVPENVEHTDDVGLTSIGAEADPALAIARILQGTSAPSAPTGTTAKP